MMIVNLIIGSVTGGLSRYFFSGLVHRFFGSAFPWGTLFVNLLGCFMIGVFSAIAEEKFFLGPETRLLLMTGFCGAFTTFSTLIYETANLFRDGEPMAAVVNIVLSLVAGFLVFKIGVLAGEII